MKYIIKIEERRAKNIIVRTDTKDKALEMAKDIYYSGQEVLNADNLKEVRFKVLKEKKDERQ